MNRVVVGRLVMPIGVAHNLAVGLFDFLKKQGYIAPVPAEQNN